MCRMIFRDLSICGNFSFFNLRKYRIWESRNSGDFVSKSGETRFTGAAKRFTSVEDWCNREGGVLRGRKAFIFKSEAFDRETGTLFWGWVTDGFTRDLTFSFTCRDCFFYRLHFYRNFFGSGFEEAHNWCRGGLLFLMLLHNYASLELPHFCTAYRILSTHIQMTSMLKINIPFKFQKLYTCD